MQGIAFSARCNSRHLPLGISSSRWTKIEWQPRGNKPLLSQIADHSREIHDNLFYSARRWTNCSRGHHVQPARLSSFDEPLVSVFSVSIRFQTFLRFFTLFASPRRYIGEAPLFLKKKKRKKNNKIVCVRRFWKWNNQYNTSSLFIHFRLFLFPLKHRKASIQNYIELYFPFVILMTYLSLV